MSAFVALGILFGGGGAEGPFNNGVIEAAAALLLLLLAGAHFTGDRPLPASAVVPLLLVVALLCIPAAHLLPVPFSVWGGVPGRELELSALSLIGQQASWRPISLDPEATRRLVASLLPPAALMIAVLGATRREARALCIAAVAAASISSFIGALQIALDYPALLTFYDGANPGAASGVFANPNHHGMLLLTAMVFLGAWIATDRSRRRTSGDRSNWAVHPAWIAVPFLVLIVFATKSRGASALLLLALPMAVAIGLRRGRVLVASVVAGLFSILAFLFVTLSPTTQPLLLAEDGALAHDQRFSYLPDILFGLSQYWPWGSGGGTFATVFATYEDLDHVQSEILNHAHNEYLEWLTEFGAPVALLLLLLTTALARRLWQARRTIAKPRGSTAMMFAGLSILILLGCHSAVEYPMRTDALAVIGGLALGLIFAPLEEHRSKSRRSRRRTAILIASLVVGIVCAGQVLRLRTAQAMVRTNQPLSALALRPQSGDALAQAAEAQFLAKNPAAARTLAIRAIDRSPMSASAVRLLAASNAVLGRADASAWQVASAMGWRDQATQLWALHQAYLGKEHDTAAARADALLRTSTRDEFVTIVRSAAADPGFRAGLIERMRLQPGWRKTFFEIGPGVSPGEFSGVLGMVRDLARSGLLTRSDARATITLLIDRKQYDAAHGIYAAVSPRRAGLDNLNPDPGFDRPLTEYQADGTAFDWQVAPSAETVAEVDPQSRTLFIQTNGREQRRAAYRYLLAKPGRYALDYRVRGDAAGPSQIRLSVECADGLSTLGEASKDELGSAQFERRRFLFEVPESCPAVAIAFTAVGNAGRAQAEFDDVLLSTR